MGTSTASTTPDENTDVLYFQENESPGRAYFMMPKAGAQTSGAYEWKYTGWCASSNMVDYTLSGSADFDSNSVPDIVWQRNSSSSVTQDLNYVLWLMNADGH